MIAQPFLHSRSGCISHFGSDVHVEFVGQLSGPRPCEGWDLSVHRVQLQGLLEDLLCLRGGLGRVSIDILSGQGDIQHIIDDLITLETSPGMTGVVCLSVNC